jgi:hypothetical protein
MKPHWYKPKPEPLLAPTPPGASRMTAVKIMTSAPDIEKSYRNIDIRGPLKPARISKSK